MEKKTWSTHPILCVFLLYLLCTTKMVGQNMPISVGVEMEDYGDMVLNCISMALDDFYKTRLVLTNCDSKGDNNTYDIGNTSTIKSMQRVIGVKTYLPKTKKHDDFTTRHKRRNNPRGRRTRDFDLFGLQAYDSAMAAEKANVSRNSNDFEGFGISDAGPNLTHSISSTRFKGLARNFDLVNIVKMIGPGARCIAYWTKENGIVKDLTFIGEKSNLGLTKWSGDVSSSPKGWMIPTNGNTLKVGEQVTWNSINSTEVEVIGDYNDLIYQAYLRNYDVVAGDRWQYVDYSVSVTGSWPLQIIIFCSSIFLGALVWVLEHHFNEDFRGPPSEHVGMILWFAFSTIVFAHRVKAGSSLARLVLIICFTVVFVLTKSYTGFFEFVRVIWNSNDATKVERYRIDAFNAVMASLPIGFLVQHQINKYFRHHFLHQLGMTMWFAFAAFVFSHRETVVQTRPGLW